MWICETPQRLDAFLAECLERTSRSRAQKLIEAGAVTVNDEVVTKASLKLRHGDEVRVDAAHVIDEEEASDIEPVDLALHVLYEDDDCFVIDKPAGIAAHPAPGIAKEEPTLLHGLAYMFDVMKLPFSPSSTLVHRLDRGTTGALLCAKTPEAHAALQKQFRDRTVAKFYLALVAGIPNPSAAVIDAPIGRHVHERTKMAVTRTSSSRESRTTYVTLDSVGDVSLIECELHTGRTHQIRVHLASVGHPLLGDDAYASAESERLNHKHGIDAMCLHAWKLTFDSPFTDKEVFVKAPVPYEFTDTLASLGLRLTAE